MDPASWDARYAATDLVWGVEPNRWVSDVLAGRPAGSAVDLGCGEGRNAIWLAETGWTVTGVDFSGVALDKAATLAQRRGVTVRWVRADATTWASEQPVDLVVVAYLQLRAAERRQAHRAAAEALAPGATLLVVGHDTTNLTDGVGGPQDAGVLFSPADVLTDTEGLGLTAVRAERVRRPVDTPSGTRDAIDALIELRRPTAGR